MNPHEFPNHTIRFRLLPGDLGQVVSLHGTLYAKERGWDETFEADVAGPLAAFALRKNPRERIWLVESMGSIRGCLAIVERNSDMAQLRWFLLHPQLRGQGLGKSLLSQAMHFCRESHYSRMVLFTVKGLEVAAALYSREGFHLIEETEKPLWGTIVTEQRWECSLGRDLPGIRQ